MDKLKENESVLKLKKFYFKRACIEVDEHLLQQHRNFAVQRHIKPVDEHEYQVTLNLELSEDNFNINIIAIGLFEFSSDKTELSDLVKDNTAAIMFPYIRSELTLLTAQPGMRPIVLPAMNINTLLNKREEEQGS